MKTKQRKTLIIVLNYKSLSNNVRYTFVGSFVFAMPSYYVSWVCGQNHKFDWFVVQTTKYKLGQ